MMGLPSLEGVEISKEIQDSAMCELMNQISGSIISTASDMVKESYDISCPQLIKGSEFNLSKDYKIILNVFHNAKDEITLKLVNCIK